MRGDYYATTARHYDPSVEADAALRDLGFWLDLAQEVEGPILEVACGTGRVLLPVARAGRSIDGLDVTPSLLEVLRAKLSLEPPEVQARVQLHEGDMRDFSLERRYSLIMLPFRPFQHMLTLDDQQRAMDCLAHHLQPGGRLALNVFYPKSVILEDLGQEREEQSWVDPVDPTVTVTRSFLGRAHHKLHQYFEAEFIFRSYRDGELIAEERSALNLAYFTYPHMVLLLRGAGLRVVAEYGSFDKEPIEICKEMIFVAEKPIV